jgi:hypothetical protein
MKSNLIPVTVTVVLTVLLAVIFKTLLHKPLDVVPLYLVPIFFYIGHLTGKSPETWAGITVAVTVVLVLLYVF